ncbi:MAG: hypothetical protein ACLQIJ_20325, partial [Polyangia bacterium]
MRILDPEQRLLAGTWISAGTATAKQSDHGETGSQAAHQKATSARRVNTLFFKSAGIPLELRP